MNHEAISVLDMFKIGVGPSSSHTLGPWRAAAAFVTNLFERNLLESTQRVEVKLYGSLAKTGKGHGTDIAVMMGLQNEDPVTFEVEKLDETITVIRSGRQLNLGGHRSITFAPENDILFLKSESLPRHPNAMTLTAFSGSATLLSETYYSIGGGFIEKEGATTDNTGKRTVRYHVNDADELIQNCKSAGISISQLVFENEKAWRSEGDTRRQVLHIWHTMAQCIWRGCHRDGVLPGGLNVSRRAARMNRQLLRNASYSGYNDWIAALHSAPRDFNTTLNFVSCFALAVNEENAAFGRVVTAPTNGAAGVVPAVLMYYHIFCNGTSDDSIVRFLLTASEIGSLFKKGSTISAAMGGCQAEIGVSSAMAAAALTECLGGDPAQTLQAAEIAMEHHLGMTCDPVGGLVQIPCIERNTMGAIKAIAASQLAIQSDPEFAKVSLDSVIKTMWETALDMNSKYKETSDGGLATNIPLGLSEC